MIYHNINPVLLEIGPLEIKYYGLVYVLGLLLAYFILRNIVRKNKIENLDIEKLYDLIIYIALGVILGARLLYFVFYSPLTFFYNPLEIFMVWQGGMSFHGGLIGLVIAVLVFSRKYKVKFYDLADVLVIPAALALFLGRIVNFVNAELIGTKTGLPFCIQYDNVEGCRHPSQIYEALKNLVMFFTLLFLRTKKKLKSGTLFWLFVLMYGVLRFLVTFFREDARFLGLSEGQYLSLAMVVVASVFLYRINKK